jgi:ATP-dependent DNA helicase RecG
MAVSTSRLGVLLPDDHLTQPGALVFCPADRNYVTVTVLDVEGGDVISTPPGLRGLSLLGQLAATEDRLDPLNSEVVMRGSFGEVPVRRLPPQHYAKRSSTAWRIETGTSRTPFR